MNNTKLRYKFRMFIRTLPYHFLVMGSVFIVAVIFNKYLEALCFLTAFFSLRYKFETTYHSESVVLCMIFTVSMFTLSIVICPPIYMYLLVSILFAYLDCFILYSIQLYRETKFEKERLINENAEIQYLLAESHKDKRKELLDRCAEARLSERNTKVAEMYFIDRKKPKEIWKWLCDNHENMEYDSVYILLNRISKKIK